MLLVIMRGLDLAVELHMPAQVELVRHIVEIFQILRLTRKALFPVPFVEQFIGEGITVGIAF